MTTPRPWLLIALFSCACDGRALPAFPATGEQELALSRAMSPGGPPAPVASFPPTVYGSSFVRLMTDGTLYFGTPSAVRVRVLEPAELSGLLEAWSEERLGPIARGYDLSIEQCLREGVAREQCPRLGNPSREGYRFPGEGGLREVSIANGSASSLGEWDGLVPATLVGAARALEDVATGGERWLASAFVLQAIVEVHLDPDALAWDVPGLPLATVVSASKNGSELLVTDPAAVAALQRHFSVGNDAYASFRDGGQLYLVGACPVLPGGLDR